MRNIVIAVGVLALAAYAWNSMSGPSDKPMGLMDIPTRDIETYPNREVPTGTDHPCYRKSRCLVAYVAPWCPACKKSLPLINEVGRYLNARDDAGYVVVMGTLGRSWDGYQAMAEQIGQPLYVDRNSDLWRAADGAAQGTPGWIAYDGAGVVIDGLSGGYPQSSQRYVDEILERVGLESLSSRTGG